MAIINQMTEAELQTQLHLMHSGNTNTPASNVGEYTRRRGLLNAGIDRWQHDKGYLWDELWSDTVLDGAGATLTVVNGTADYAVPTKFRFPGGWVELMSGTQVHSRYPVVEPEEAQSLGTSRTYAYFYGSPNGGYKLRLNPTPGASEAGKTLKYPYYKWATKLVLTTDISECPDPYFLIYYALSELSRRTRIDLYTAALNDAEERLRQMEVRQFQQASFNQRPMRDVSGGIWGKGRGYKGSIFRG